MVALFHYLFSPVQLILTFIPVTGQLDDLIMLYVSMKLAGRIGIAIGPCALCSPGGNQLSDV